MQNLYYDVTGQTLYFDAPEGRPSSVTSVTVFPSGTGDDGTAEDATTGVPSVETDPDTTFDAASGDGQADPKVMNVTATTGGTVGRQYLITNAGLESERVEVTSVQDGVSMTAKHDLLNAYAAADTLESTRMSIAVDATWIADDGNISDDLNPNPGYRVQWVYVVDSITRRWDTYFNVVRYRADHSVTPGQVAAVRSNWIVNLPSEQKDDDGASLIDTAYEELRMDFHRFDLPIEMLRNREVLDRLLIRKAILMASEDRAARPGQDTVAYEIDLANYNGMLEALVKITNKTATAFDTGGASGTVETVSHFQK